MPRADAGARATPSHLLTPKQVADWLGSTPKTVLHWARIGELRSVRRVGSDGRAYWVRFRASEVEKFIESLEG